MLDMRILIINSEKPYNAEYFFKRAFERLGYTVDLIDQYMGIRREDLVRIDASRFKSAGFSSSACPLISIS